MVGVVKVFRLMQLQHRELILGYPVEFGYGRRMSPAETFVRQHSKADLRPLQQILEGRGKQPAEEFPE